MSLLNDYIGLGILKSLMENYSIQKTGINLTYEYIIDNFIKLEKKYFLNNKIIDKYFQHLTNPKEWKDFKSHICSKIGKYDKQIKVLRKKSVLISKFYSDVNKEDFIEKYILYINNNNYCSYAASINMIFDAEILLDKEDYLYISKKILKNINSYSVTTLYEHFIYKWSSLQKKDFLEKKLFLKETGLHFERRAIFCHALCSSGLLTHKLATRLRSECLAVQSRSAIGLSRGINKYSENELRKILSEFSAMKDQTALNCLVKNIPRKFLYLFVQSSLDSKTKILLETRLQGEKDE